MIKSMQDARRTPVRCATAGALTALLLIGGTGSGAQIAASPDPQVRATQHWEDFLLLEDFDYLQLNASQTKEMSALAEYARTRMDEVEQQRVRLRKTVDDQHLALMKGQRPSNGDQLDVLQKQRQIADREEAVSKEIVDRVAPRLGGILSRKQTVRAWLLMQNKIPASEPKRIALTDPVSGFVFPQMEARDAIEEIVKSTLRQKYAPDVVDQALVPWEFASLGTLMGNGPLGTGRGAPGSGGPIDRTKVIGAFQDMDPRMGSRMLTLGQKMLKQYLGGGDPSAPQPPPVPPETRTAINKDADAIRKAIADDPEAYLSQLKGDQMLEALRPLARRLFLSPRIKEALAEKGAR